MKGCPLNCLWCHNPESKSNKPQIFFDTNKCTACGRCIDVCELYLHSITDGVHFFNRNDCIACGKCADKCLNSALELTGYEQSVDDILKEVLKDKIFYENSNGGMTVSGGEPMYQFEFTYELLKAAKKEGLHICMETCGFANEENYKKIAGLVDIFLFDYKLTSAELHKKYTGVSNELILKNLKMLDELGCRIILRCPIIPTVNDTEEHFCGIADTANSLKNILEINIEPYHPLGNGKNEMLGNDYELKDLTFPSDDTVAEWIKIISEKTSVTVKKA